MKSLVESYTEPTAAKPMDGTVLTTVDPKISVAKVSATRALLILASRKIHAKAEVDFGRTTSQGEIG